MTLNVIDLWVNVSMGSMADTPFMQKVKEEYFKAGDDFFRNIEADELISLMDKEQGEIIQEVIDAGLWDDTIVVFYSDHGGVLSRSKRYIYNGGTQVPLIVRVPEKWKHLAPGKPGTANDEFVQFVDLPKTMLDICGLRVPEVMQGRVFMGPNKEPAPKTMICYRDRQSDKFDCSRVATDGEHYLIRNFYPHRPRGP